MLTSSQNTDLALDIAMNRPGAQPRAQPSSVPVGYRSGVQGSQSAGTNGMYYASVGQHTAASTGQNQQTQSGRTNILGQQQGGPGGFPSSSASLTRTGPPGFGGRGADPNDFPALGSVNASHVHLSNPSSTYAAQAQPSQGTNQTHLQQLHFMQQQQQQQQTQTQQPTQQQQLDASLTLPPPPGLSVPVTSPLPQTNGIMPVGSEALREDFPALGAGDSKESRMAALLKMASGSAGQQPSSPQTSLGNGPSTSQSTSETPHLSAGGPPSTDDSSWARQSPSRLSEPLVRPVQQIMSSPVDKWGLKALLYEIQTQMGKGDRGLLMFGEDLAELGVDVSAADPLYSTFVTPWVEPGSLQQPPQVEDLYTIPTCYHVQPPPMETKLVNFAEDTLFYIFYSAPQDVSQLMAAEGLFNRGWRFSTELRVWLYSTTFAQYDLHGDRSSIPALLRGPFIVFNPSTFARQKTGDEFSIESSTLEATRPAASIVAEDSSRKEAAKGSNGNPLNSGILSTLAGNIPSNQSHFQGIQSAR